jgi:hypothetical protein
MIDRARVSEILTAKAEIETALEDRGFLLDPQSRAALGWVLKSLIEDDGYSPETAAARILEMHQPQYKKAA